MEQQERTTDIDKASEFFSRRRCGSKMCPKLDCVGVRVRVSLPVFCLSVRDASQSPHGTTGPYSVTSASISFSSLRALEMGTAIFLTPSSRIRLVPMENSMKDPQKTKDRITIWSSNPTPEHTCRQNSNLKRYVHLCVKSSTIHNSQDMEVT